MKPQATLFTRQQLKQCRVEKPAAVPTQYGLNDVLPFGKYAFIKISRIIELNAQYIINLAAHYKNLHFKKEVFDIIKQQNFLAQ